MFASPLSASRTGWLGAVVAALAMLAIAAGCSSDDEPEPTPTATQSPVSRNSGSALRPTRYSDADYSRP